MIKFQDDRLGDAEILSTACVGRKIDLDARRMVLTFQYEPDDRLGMKNLIDRHMFRDVQVVQYAEDDGTVHHIITDPTMVIPVPVLNQYEVRYIIHAHAVDGLNTLGEKNEQAV